MSEGGQLRSAIIGEWEWPEGKIAAYYWCFAWLGHWPIAGVMLWGIPLVLMHDWALCRLAATASDPIAPLLVMLVSQSVVSTVVTILIRSREGAGQRRAAAGLTIFVCATICLWWNHRHRNPAVLDD